ncbi:cytochrome P450 family protein [Herpetosiphon geysericola]|uniref:Cytochrome P450 n=1 Tax=Herpetosiphon geysericola TaxID=70996 RepID=A0A0P6YI73_9CHLR|nr:cytochrome P450 [Herpetosiphon geysericola]KPL90213.1 cytochrome P450 [Herpetosiphon geysericola]
MQRLAQEQTSIPAIINLTDRQFKADPFTVYARLRRDRPVAKAKLGSMQTWIVTRYADVVEILKNDRLFVKNYKNAQSLEQQRKRPWMPKIFEALESNMLDQDSPDHGRLRSLVHKAFTPQRVEEMRPRIQQIAEALLISTQQRGRGDLIADFALPLPLTVIVELLGIPSEDRQKFHRWSKYVLSTPTIGNVLLAIPAIMAQMKYLKQLFAKRRNQPQADLLTALVQAEADGDRFSEDELVAMVFLLMLAGHETTVNLLSSGTLALLQNPEQLALLRRSPELIKSAVEELVRFTAPVETATERYAAEDVIVADTKIAKGDLLLVALASANRDPQQFVNPDELDITREKNRHVGFGLGIHYCLGAPLARMEAQIGLQLLFDLRPNLRLTVPAEQLRWRSTAVVRGLQRLPVAW